MTTEIKELLSNGIKKHYPADDAHLADVLGFTESFLDEAECSMKVIMSVTVVVEEIFVNVAHYAYSENETGTVTMTVATGNTSGGKTLAFRFEDTGLPFDPLAQEDPDITLDLSERQVGGLGIYMVKKMTNGVYYEYTEGRNVLTFYKYI